MSFSKNGWDPPLYRSAGRELLRDKILIGGIEGGWKHKRYLKRLLADARVIEASQATNYYFRNTPTEQVFDITVAPNISYESEEPFFFEGEVPVAGSVGSSSELLRLGLLIKPVAPSASMLAEESTASAMQVAAFHETAPRVLRGVRGPGLWWLITADRDGRPQRDPHGNIQMGEVERRNSVGKLLIGASRRARIEACILREAEMDKDSLHVALFCLCCMNAARGYSMRASLQPVLDQRTPYSVLRMEQLKERLDADGKAPEIGLGHALTVCRQEFG